jgi:hypothetical protein
MKPIIMERGFSAQCNVYHPKTLLSNLDTINGKQNIGNIKYKLYQHCFYPKLISINIKAFKIYQAH